MNRHLIWMTVILMLLMNSFVFILPNTSYNAGADDPSTKWTFMVYMDADNNLEAAGVEDMNEMETVGSSDDVNIIVQMDRIPEYDVTNGDWTGTKRFKVIQDEDKEIINSPVVEDLDEINMGDPESLIDFVLWGAKKYPAEHYIVVLWDHGGAFWGICFDDTGTGSEADAIDMPEMRYAFTTINEKLGRNIDIVGFDACLMAEVAVLYQLRDVVDYSVASGFVEPGDGWPYERILPDLIDNPYMDPVELGKLISDAYVDSYTDKMGDPDDSTAITMSLFDLEQIPDAIERLNEFSMVLSTSAMIHNAQIWTARDLTESYDMVNAGPFDFTGYAMYDVIDFTEKIQQLVPLDNDVISSASALRESAYEFILYSRVDQYHPNAHGLTIYFPNEESTIVDIPGRNTYDARFNDVDFAKDKYWDDFLFHYYGRENAGNTPPTAAITYPMTNDTFSSSEDSITIKGTAFDAQDQPEIKIRIDEGEWASVNEDELKPTGTIYWSYQWDIKGLKGAHDIQVQVTDTDGNSYQVTNSVNVQGEDKSGESDIEATYPYLILGIAILIIIAVLSLLVSRMRQIRKI